MIKLTRSEKIEYTASIMGQKTLNISLPPELEQFVQEKVQAGQYQSASEVVQEGLRLLEECDNKRTLHLEEVRQKIALGLEQVQRGEVEDGDTFFNRLKEKMTQ